MLTGKALIEDMNACRVPAGQVAFWWLGQHGFVLKIGESICYVDVFFSPVEGRQVPPLLKPEEVTNATVILGSHDHADHIDREAWPALAQASPKATFVVPKLLRERVARELKIPDARVWGVDEGITLAAGGGGGVQITAVPAAHEFMDTDAATGLHPFIGFIITGGGGGGVTVYHAGDTCLYEGMQGILRRWKFDLVFLPINGRDAKRLRANCIGNMTYQEAADLAGAIAPGLVVPAHFEMFSMNSENPELFVDYMRVKYPGIRAIVPEHGRRMLVGGKA